MKQDVHYVNGSTKFAEISFHPLSLRVDDDFRLAAYFSEMQSGLSININYALHFFTLPPDMYGGIGWLAMKQDKNVDELKYSVMLLSDRVQMSNEMVYGQMTTPLYSYGGRHCFPVMFPQRLRAPPVVIVNTALLSFELSQLVTTWIESTSTTQMTVCMQEVFAFSGLKYNHTLHYLAIVPESNAQAANSTGGGQMPTEVGRLTFPKGMYPNPNPMVENLRYCKNIQFKHIYHEVPHVFVTPQNGEDPADHYIAGSVVAWVNEVSRHHATICAKNKNDEYFKGVADIKVNFMVQGKLDACSDAKTCPENLQCVVDRVGQPTCDCITDCPKLTTEDEQVCGTDFVTYPSRCHMLMEACRNYGKQLFERVTVAYSGKCRGKNNYLLSEAYPRGPRDPSPSQYFDGENQKNIVSGKNRDKFVKKT